MKIILIIAVFSATAAKICEENGDCGPNECCLYTPDDQGYGTARCSPLGDIGEFCEDSDPFISSVMNVGHACPCKEGNDIKCYLPLGYETIVPTPHGRPTCAKTADGRITTERLEFLLRNRDRFNRRRFNRHRF